MDKTETPKTNAPERIYLQDGIDKDDAEGGVVPAGTYDGNEDMTWCKDCINDNDTEYVRADIAERENADLRRQLAAERGRVVELAYSVKVRGEALAASGDLELSAIGEHYVGIADEIRALADPQQSAPAADASRVMVPVDLLRRARNMCLRCVSEEYSEAKNIVAELDAIRAASAKVDAEGRAATPNDADAIRPSPAPSAPERDAQQSEQNAEPAGVVVPIKTLKLWREWLANREKTDNACCGIRCEIDRLLTAAAKEPKCQD